MKVVSSREFNQDVSAAKRFARVEPVLITDRGKPTHVLLSIEAFRRFSGQQDSIVDLLDQTQAGDAFGDGDLWLMRERWDRS